MVLAHHTEAIQQLQQQVTGSVITPDDTDYDKIRRGWNLTIDQHPAVILVPENVQDVAAGVNFAREAGLGISIQLSGHGIKYPADDGMLIVTSRLNRVEIDAQARTARIESGVIWHQVVEAATPHGLAPLVGTSPHVGVVGYTLGGGISWLGRKYGFAADSVRWIEVVTPDGVLRRASPTENRDLFRGLLGGGGNFGVVTAMEFTLYPVATIYGGALVYPGDRMNEALKFFRDWTKNAPDELTSSLAILKFPDSPQMPEAIRGKIQIFVRAVFTGSAAGGQRLIQSWLDWNTPLSNTFHEMRFAEIGTVSNDPVDPVAGYTGSEMLNDLSDGAIETIIRHATDRTTPLVMTEIRHLGGAIARGSSENVSVSNRDAQFYVTMGGPVFVPQLFAPLKAAIEAYRRDLQQHASGGVYLNFAAAGESHHRAKDAYSPETYQHMLALKAKYDPENQFRFSYQLVPAETLSSSTSA
jgi:hypothetical protein